MKELKADIKSKTFKRVYLLYGAEKYLIRYYENLLKETLLPPGADIMNLDIFDGKAVSPDRIRDAVQTAPFLNEYRLVLARDTKLFVSGRKADSEKTVDILGNIPESTVLVFVEDEADKRLRLFKRAGEAGRIVEFKTPTDKELSEWVVNMVKKRGGTIARDAVAVLLRTAAHNMEALSTEIAKLTGYVGAGREIKASDIESVCTPALETQIFDLVGAVGNKKPERALDIFSNMLLMKEQPLVVLTMIARQFRIVLQSKALAEKGRSNNDIANFLSIRGFVVTECLRQGRGFKTDDLISALKDCLEADMNIKSGRISDKLAVETLIVKYAS
ncbi:MAG: DNA polymerase III subunit delta [Clostridiales bacterium]|jgi:DNA polymerase-3 subunit delta|nr:DNA polymerase III subunit delta [Clostridiales bacterium]